MSIAFLLIILHFASGQVVFIGSCPNVTTVENFEASRYLGKWFEIEKYFAVFEFGGKCVSAEYSLNNNGSITVVNSQVSEITNTPSSIIGHATSVGSPTEAKLSVIFPSLPVSFAAPYWVIGTDYDNYAVVWSCVPLGLVNSRYLWILARTRSPTKETMGAAYAILDRYNITTSLLMKTNQENC